MSGALLQSIANPPNPLTTLQQDAAGIDALRSFQAKQATSQAYQQAINPTTGQFDQGKFNALVSQGPAAWNAGQTMQQAGQAMTSQGYGQQQQLAAQLAKTQALTGLATPLMQRVTAGGTVTADDINGIVKQGQDSGILSPTDAAFARAKLTQPGTNPVDLLRGWYFANQSAQAQIGSTLPTTQLQDLGGQLVAVPTNPYLPNYPKAGTGYTLTATPGQVFGAADVSAPATSADVAAAAARGQTIQVGQTILLPRAEVIRRQGLGGVLPPSVPQGQGGSTAPAVVRDSAGNPVGPRNPPRLLNVPGQPAPTTTTPATQPAPVTTAPATTPPATPPPVTAPVPPRIRPVPTVDLGAQGGVAVASNNPLEAPDLGPASPPSPEVAGDVNAMMQGIDRARGASAPGTLVAAGGPPAAPPGGMQGVPIGPGYDEQATAKISQDRFAADSAMAANYANNAFPQTQALSLLGRGMTTAPTTDLLNTAKSWAGGVARSMGYSGLFSETQEYDALHKWLSQIITNNPVAQGSDARMAQTLSGNANTGIHELASSDMLKAGIGIMRMNATANSEWQNMPPEQKAQYGGYYSNFLRDFSKNTDPRAFMDDMLNPVQQKDLLDDWVKRNDQAGAQKYLDSRAMAIRNGYVQARPPPRTSP